MKLVIGWLYPDLMSTYGDRGNIICLEKRCQWREIEVETKNITLENDVLDLRQCDLLFMGGAQDRQQKIASDDLRHNKGPVIKEMIESGIPGLFICGAYQFMGHYYKLTEKEIIKGLSIFDLYTKHPGKWKPRCIGDLVIETGEWGIEFGRKDKKIVGFENHGGRTYLGKGVLPFGRVLVGQGNNGEDKTEGCVYKNAIGSYLHGPILPKNSQLADWLIKTALSKKYGNDVILEQLDDGLEWQAHDIIVKKLI